MGRLLAALIADSGNVPAATPATPATLGHPSLPKVAESQKSHGVHVLKPKLDIAAIRARLLELTAAAYMDPAPVRALPESYLRDCAGLSDDAMRALLSMLADDAERRAGRVPNDDTAGILCRSCGPVYLHPSIAAVLPVVNGWPRALGCPWCHLPKVGNNMGIPRPPVTCGACKHFELDAINPAGGVGSCRMGITPRRAPYPLNEQYCGNFRS